MLRIATLNQYQRGMSQDDLSDVGQPVNGGEKGYKVHVWETLRGWGQRLYRKADILFLTEVRNGSHVHFLAQPDVTGLRHYAMMQEEYYTDLVILSRYPLSDVHPIYMVDEYKMLAAKVNIKGQLHQLIIAHWNKGESNSQTRRQATQLCKLLVTQHEIKEIVGHDDIRPKSEVGSRTCISIGIYPRPSLWSTRKRDLMHKTIHFKIKS